jgi:hypothetical protein
LLEVEREHRIADAVDGIESGVAFFNALVRDLLVEVLTMSNSPGRIEVLRNSALASLLAPGPKTRSANRSKRNGSQRVNRTDIPSPCRSLPRSVSAGPPSISTVVLL